MAGINRCSRYGYRGGGGGGMALFYGRSGHLWVVIYLVDPVSLTLTLTLTLGGG